MEAYEEQMPEYRLRYERGRTEEDVNGGVHSLVIRLNASDGVLVRREGLANQRGEVLTHGDGLEEGNVLGPTQSK